MDMSVFTTSTDIITVLLSSFVILPVIRTPSSLLNISNSTKSLFSEPPAAVASLDSILSNVRNGMYLSFTYLKLFPKKKKF